jgi:hypothetical protein
MYVGYIIHKKKSTSLMIYSYACMEIQCKMLSLNSQKLLPVEIDSENGHGWFWRLIGCSVDI